ncbi:MAG: imidazole glycerol phosphate synthase subunit HisH [Clostridium sp.]|nr:imidazole glycerol phosphate synthase subunit HisH [Clostridium sp.]
MIVIIDYGMGNLKSVENALKKIGFRYKISSEKNDIYIADGIILPGVGAFKDAMENLKKRGLIQPVKEKINDGCPFLGICLGMHMLYEAGYEGERSEGLGFLQGNIKLMKLKEDVKIPHIGWNRLEVRKKHKILNGLSKEAYVYFVHSYMAVRTKSDEVIAEVEYGKTNVPALVGRDNIIGAQFHPEKSGEEGLKILRSFGEMIK